MRLLHYSAKPFAFDVARSYGPIGTGCYKPGGLWVSVEGEQDWPSWCRAERFYSPGILNATEIVLRDDANVLVLDSALDVRVFDERFKIDRDRIDWQRVQSLHDGLIIAPYQWSCRLELMWYYGWDCASGVLWNLNAISRVSACEPIEFTEAA